MSYNKAEQNCEAKAYLAYVEQAIEVPTQEDGIYDAFQKRTLCLAGTALLKERCMMKRCCSTWEALNFFQGLVLPWLYNSR